MFLIVMQFFLQNVLQEMIHQKRMEIAEKNQNLVSSIQTKTSKFKNLISKTDKSICLTIIVYILYNVRFFEKYFKDALF